MIRTVTYLGMCLQDSHPPRSMRFLRHEPQKVRWILGWRWVYQCILAPIHSKRAPRRPLLVLPTIYEGFGTTEEAEIWENGLNNQAKTCLQKQLENVLVDIEVQFPKISWTFDFFFVTTSEPRGTTARSSSPAGIVAKFDLNLQLQFLPLMDVSIPPGIGGNLDYMTSGGCNEWMAYTNTKFYTNAFIVQYGKVGHLLTLWRPQ